MTRAKTILKIRKLYKSFIRDKFGNIINGYYWNQVIREDIEKLEKQL